MDSITTARPGGIRMWGWTGWTMKMSGYFTQLIWRPCAGLSEKIRKYTGRPGTIRRGIIIISSGDRITMLWKHLYWSAINSITGRRVTHLQPICRPNLIRQQPPPCLMWKISTETIPWMRQKLFSAITWNSGRRKWKSAKILSPT